MLNLVPKTNPLDSLGTNNIDLTILRLCFIQI